jgi:hypothetical protein
MEGSKKKFWFLSQFKEMEEKRIDILKGCVNTYTHT